jgi:hypothetical protein
MKMIKLSTLVVVALIFGLVGCTLRQNEGEDLGKANPTEKEKIINSLTYIKDNKGNLHLRPFHVIRLDYRIAN